MGRVSLTATAVPSFCSQALLWQHLPTRSITMGALVHSLAGGH